MSSSSNYALVGFETKRLRFRKLKPSDFEAWLPLFDTPKVATFLGMDPKLSKKELCDLWFEKTLTRYIKNTGFMNVLTLKDTGEIVGQCGILDQTIEGKPYTEIGYSILPKHWKKGYGTEAAIACKNEAFKRGINSLIVSHIDKENLGSIKIAKRNGMKKIHEYTDERSVIMTIYGITIDKWLNQD